MQRALVPLVAILILGGMAYGGWLTSDWGSLAACAPAILVIVAAVGGLVTGVIFHGTGSLPAVLGAHAEPALELAVARVAAERARSGRPSPRDPRPIYNERKIRGVLTGIGDFPLKHSRKSRRPLEVAHVLEQACTGCGVCIPFCPSDCIEVEDSSRWPNRAVPPARIRYDECTGCGICMHVCEELAWDATIMRPTEAIERELGIVIRDTPADRGRLPDGF